MQDRPGPGRIKIAHLSSVHPADDIRILWKECVSLAQAGYDVAFVVPANRPAHRAGPDQDVAVLTVRARPSRFGRILLSVVAVLATGLRRDADIYHFHDPELIPAGLLLRLLGKRVIYDAHEDLSQNLANRRWIPRPLRYPATLAASAAEWLAGHALSGVVAATPVIARRFPQARVALVQNFARPSEFAAPGASLDARPFAVAYVGAMVPTRCAAEMVEAMAKIEKHPDARLVIAGGISPASLMEMLSASPGWRRVDYRGRQGRAGVRAVLAEARLGLALYHPVQAHIDCQPTKLFEYMAAGLPVIAADFPGFRAIVEANRCGLCVPPRDVTAIAAAIEWLFAHPKEAQQMGHRGREAALRSFSWTSEEKTLLLFYDRIAAGLAHQRKRRRRATAGYTDVPGT